MTKRKKKQKENKRAKEEKKYKVYIYIYKLLFMIRGMLSLNLSTFYCCNFFSRQRVKA